MGSTVSQPAGARDPFGARAQLAAAGSVDYFSLESLAKRGVGDIARLPYSIRVLLENLLRHCDGYIVTEDDVAALARWQPTGRTPRAIAFMPARVLLQDLTGVPAVADLAAMRSAVHRLGHDARQINPIVPVDLVIDHSVQVDRFGTEGAFAYNVDREFERNRERYVFLRWAQEAFSNFRVVPPDTGIVHQVNLEYLASVVQTSAESGRTVAYPDTLVGTDSHTTMINGLGVVGWGVGGIEAEAVMLGQPLSMLMPDVVGFRLAGQLRPGVTATDLVLTVTQMLRKKGVVDKFVEFVGAGLGTLSLADRATIGNMAPEYGATIGFFPVDEVTLQYLRATGRDESLVQLVEAYTKAQGMFRTESAPEPVYTDTVDLDLASVEPSLAGPRRPQDRVPLQDVKQTFVTSVGSFRTGAGRDQGPRSDRYAVEWSATEDSGAVTTASPAESAIGDGTVAIAAITSCTNTSNPSVMIAAGLLARNAVARGLTVKPYVKTSLAPGSRVVLDYLEKADLMKPLEALRFNAVGFGCTTCIGNSGPLPDPVAKTIRDNDLVVAAVLSGNRNFEGRINPDCRMNFLASPPLVVAYALAGRVDLDLTTEPLGQDSAGQPVYLRDIWPSPEEVSQTVDRAVDRADFVRRYSAVFEGNERWQSLPVPEGDLYAWDPSSTYIQEPPFFAGLSTAPASPPDVVGARVLALLGDSVTTDHISPAGSISIKSPAARYLMEHGVGAADFNTYGARRGNHEVMVRGTFANIRLRNQLAPGTEGGVAPHFADGDVQSIFDTALRYQAEGTPLIVVAGREYGSGSSRDWAAKGPLLLGVRAALAQSFERIHRSNLIGMGVLPLEFQPGETLATHDLTGAETFDLSGIAAGLTPRKPIQVRAHRADGTTVEFTAIARLESPVEIEYFNNGGILQTVLRRMLS